MPPEGGTFYTHEAADSSRSYYKSSWPPLLQAAGLWLGFNNNNSSSSSSNSNGGSLSSADAYEPDNVYSNHLFLVLGISMEALCDAKSTEPESSTAACLDALQALLHSPTARFIVVSQPALGVEVTNVLHRVILTKHAANQRLALVVLLVLVQAARDQLQRLDDPCAGEGGPSGDLLPGTSLAFAALEVCLCLFVKYHPNLDPSSSSSRSSSSSNSSRYSLSLCRYGSISYRIFRDNFTVIE